MEVGESGTPHLQGFVYFKNARVMPKWNKRIHWERAKHIAKAIEYCHKEDKEPFEFGSKPEHGKRTDLDALRSAVTEEGLNSMRKIIPRCTNLQSVRMAETLLRYYEKPRTWKPEVYWL